MKSNCKVLFSLMIALMFSCKKDPQITTRGGESYRYELWKNLVESNWRIDFIGTIKDDGNYPLYKNNEFDRDHQGIGGRRTEGILKDLHHVIANIPTPDIVLLGIGINDLRHGHEAIIPINNIDMIIDTLRNSNSKITIFLEKVATDENKEMNPDFSRRYEDFINKLSELKLKKDNDSSRIILVDMNSNWNESYTVDGLHYNENGAKEVADRYFYKMNSVLVSTEKLTLLPLGDSRVKGARY